MKHESYTLKGKLKYLNGTILILSLFLLDSILGSVTLLMGQAETMDEWMQQIQIFQGARSVFTWMPYIVILLLTNYKLYVTREDELLLVLCILFSFIDTTDYFINVNWRPVWMDWIVFGIFALTLIYFKIRSVIKRIH